MQDLVSKIIYNSERYYAGEPEISDQAFDALIEKLKKIQPKHPILSTPNWGAIEPGKKKPHFGGLVEGIKNKVKYEKKKGELNNLCGVVTPKYDGMSVVITAVMGRITALTRNNGELGVDITENILYILDNSFPDFKEHLLKQLFLSIRCEVLTDRFFESVLKEQGITAFRNFSAGKLLSRRPEDKPALKYLTIKPLFVRFSDEPFKDYIDMLDSVNFLQNLISYRRVDKEELEPIYKKWSAQYYTDGLVFREIQLPSPSILDLGWTKVYNYSEEENHSAIAIKFAGDTVRVQVKEVVWTLSKGNKMIPVVHIHPIELGGVTISKAAGFNAEYISNHSITPGTVFNLTRSNDVIPHIVSVDYTDRLPPTLPKYCPSCKGELEWSGVHLACNNIWCNLTGLIENIIQFVPIPDFVGLPTLFPCYDKPLFSHNHITSFLESVSLEALGEGKIREYAEQHKKELIEAFQIISYEDFWKVSNIPSIGKKVAEKLSTVPPMRETTPLHLLGLGVPSHVREAILESHRSYIIQLASFFTLRKEEKERKGNVVITGKLQKPRKEIEKSIEELGFTVSTAINSAVCLICNEVSSSSKYKKAEKAGIPILTEKEFFDKYS